MTRHRQRVHGVPRPRAGRLEEVPQVIEVPQTWIPTPTILPALSSISLTPLTSMPVGWRLPDSARSQDEDIGYGMGSEGAKSHLPRLTRDVDWI